MTADQRQSAIAGANPYRDIPQASAGCTNRGASMSDDISTLPEFYFGQIDKKQLRQFEELVSKVAAQAVIRGRGRFLLEYVYLAGLWHGSQLSGAKQDVA